MAPLGSWDTHPEPRIRGLLLGCNPRKLANLKQTPRASFFLEADDGACFQHVGRLLPPSLLVTRRDRLLSLSGSEGQRSERLKPICYVPSDRLVIPSLPSPGERVFSIFRR